MEAADEASFLSSDDDCDDAEVTQEEEALLLREDDDNYPTLELDYEDIDIQDLEDEENVSARCKFTSERDGKARGVSKPSAMTHNTNSQTKVEQNQQMVHRASRSRTIKPQEAEEEENQKKFSNKGNNQGYRRLNNVRGACNNRAKGRGNGRSFQPDCVQQKPVLSVQPWLNPPRNYEQQRSLPTVHELFARPRFQHAPPVQTQPMNGNILPHAAAVAALTPIWQPPPPLQQQQFVSMLNGLPYNNQNLNVTSYFSQYSVPPPVMPPQYQNNKYLPELLQNRNIAFGSQISQISAGLQVTLNNSRFSPPPSAQQFHPEFRAQRGGNSKNNRQGAGTFKRPNKSWQQQKEITAKRKSLEAKAQEDVKNELNREGASQETNVTIAIEPTPAFVEDAEMLAYRRKIEEQKLKREEILAEKERRRKLNSNEFLNIESVPTQKHTHTRSKNNATDSKTTVRMVTRSDGEKIAVVTSPIAISSVMAKQSHAPIATPAQHITNSNFLASRTIIQSNSVLRKSNLVIVRSLVNSGESLLQPR